METKFNIEEEVYVRAIVKSIRIDDFENITYDVYLPGGTMDEFDEEDLEEVI